MSQSHDDSFLGLDEDVVRSIDRSRETFGAMLSAAQRHLQKAFVVFVIGFTGSFYAMRRVIWPRLKAHLLAKGAKVVAVTPFDVILLQAKIGIAMGLLLALPVVVYYSRDALRRRGLYPDLSRRKGIGIGLLAVVLFVVGVGYAYTIIFPILFTFLAKNAIRAGFKPLYSIVKWTQFIVILSFVMGLSAELPLIMTVATYSGIVSYETFRNKWRHAVFAIFVFASIANGSPDPLSMSLIALPMVALYGVGLGCSKLVTATVGEADDDTSGDASVSGAQPDDLDLSSLDAEGVRAAPAEAFADRTEQEIHDLARRAKESGDVEKALALIDRYEEVQEGRETADEVDLESESDGSTDDETGNILTGTAADMVDPFTEDETTEDDIGGYYYDIRFIVESLTSKMFRIVGAFLLVTMATFVVLYRGGMGVIKRDFLARLPARIRPREMKIVLLHPIEALVFEMKISLIFGALAALPLIFYYAWPALRERGLADGDRSVFIGWAGALAVGLVVGSLVGYLYVAPRIISYLVYDAITAGMVVAYRIKNFFWLVFLTTAGIGLLVDIPVTMAMFHFGGIVSVETMYERWRTIVFGIFVATAFLTPEGIIVMLIVAVPTVGVFFLGLGLLWLATWPFSDERRAAAG